MTGCFELPIEGPGGVLLIKLELLVLSFSRGGARLVKAEFGIRKRLHPRGSFVIKGVPGEDTTSNEMLVVRWDIPRRVDADQAYGPRLPLGLRASAAIATRTDRLAMDSTGKANRAAATVPTRGMISGCTEWLGRRLSIRIYVLVAGGHRRGRPDRCPQRCVAQLGRSRVIARHVSSRRLHVHITQPGAHFGRLARIRRRRLEIWGLFVADAYTGIGHELVCGGENVARAQRTVQREINWRKTGRTVAIASAVGAQCLPIRKGVLAIGVPFAACSISAVDAGAEEHLSRARRTEGLAHLRRRGNAAHQGKYFPSQLRTQNAGPELPRTGRVGGGCGLTLKRLAKNEV